MKHNQQALSEKIIDLLASGKTLDDDEVKNLMRLSKRISIKNDIKEKLNDLVELRSELRSLNGK